MSEKVAIRRGEKIRVYPTPDQAAALRRIGGTCRLLWNVALEQRRVFGRKGRSISFESQCKELPALKEAFPFFAEVPHHCLVQTLRDLDGAYQRFFKGLAGYPKPRRKRDGRDNFRFPDPIQFKLLADGERGWLVLPKFGKRNGDLGAIQARVHRELPEGARIKTITLSQEGDWWHASLNYEVKVVPPPPSALPPVGIDLGIEVPLALSTGETFDVPRVSKRQRERMRRIQCTIARRKRGSINRRKAVQALARFRAREKRRRRDALRRMAWKIASRHGLICVEKLNVRGMSASARGTLEEPGTNVRRKAGLNRSIQDVAWSTLKLFLKEAAEKQGGRVIEVPAHHTSQTCPACGHVDEENRPERAVFSCVACLFEGHADFVAAGNILARGLALVAQTPGNFRGQPVESKGAALSVKQEVRAARREGRRIAA